MAELDGLIPDVVAPRRAVGQIDDLGGNLGRQAKEVGRPGARRLDSGAVAASNGMGDLVVIGAELTAQFLVDARVVVNAAADAPDAAVFVKI